MNCEYGTSPKMEVSIYPRNFREKVAFVNDSCEFVPSGWVRIEGDLFPLGYKVVTKEMKSLGLRQNPNIMTFSVGEWSLLPEGETMAGKEDWGGIWTALRRGSVSTLKKYMMQTYGVETRAFLTAIDRPLFANSYRIKSQGVMLLEEIFS